MTANINNYSACCILPCIVEINLKLISGNCHKEKKFIKFGAEMISMDGEILTRWDDTDPIGTLLKEKGKRVVILTHLNPDGDALGSSLGLHLLLQKSGHTSHVICPNDFPSFLKWMPASQDICIIKHNLTGCVELVKAADIIFALDFNELKRVRELKDMVETSRAYKIVIDHHPGPLIQADTLLTDTKASSTAELVYRFFMETGLDGFIDQDIATCLFTGIMTDTGCFSYNSSEKRTWETVAGLLQYGIHKDKIYALTYDNYSEHRLRLLGYCLNDKMEVLPGYHTGFISLSREDLVKYHFEPGDSEGFVNYPLSIRGVRFSALFMEKEDMIRISFRSKGGFAVNDFSKKHFNGGGHLNAAGGESYQSLEATVRLFKELLPFYKEQLNEDSD